MRRTAQLGSTPGLAAFEQVVPANPRRHSLTLFCMNGAGAVFTDSVQDPGTKGCLLPNNGTYVLLTEEDHGDLVKKAIYVKSLGGALPIGFIECVNVEG